MMQKKIKSLIYAGLGLILCVLLCGGIGMTAQAAYDDFVYEEEENGITIIKYRGEDKEVVIPDKINGTKVTAIGDSAFSGCENLTDITLPESVTSIGGFGFSGTGLTSITIPKNVRSIGNGAFYGCRSLKSITIPKGVSCIDYNAFMGCSSLTSITLPEGLETIQGQAFYGCSSLKSITIPEGVESIGETVFSGCSSLKSIMIPKSVRYISPNAFVSCKKIVITCYKDSYAYIAAKVVYKIPVKIIPETENPWKDAKEDDSKSATPAKKGTTLTISSKKIKVKVTSSSKKNPTVTVTKITDKNAKKLTIPATVKVKGVTYKVTAISDKAFKGNMKLTTVTIGSNVTKIGKAAFSGCKNLKKIMVTAGKLTTISKNAFKGINKKASITVQGTKKAKTALKKQLKKKSIGYVKTWKIK